jgi:subtilase family serine protease
VSKHGLSDAIPFSIAPGSYYLLFVLDANRDVKESNEGNNIVRVPIRLR